jgi:hypothetical protein
MPVGNCKAREESTASFLQQSSNLPCLRVGHHFRKNSVGRWPRELGVRDKGNLKIPTEHVEFALALSSTDGSSRSGSKVSGRAGWPSYPRRSQTRKSLGGSASHKLKYGRDPTDQQPEWSNTASPLLDQLEQRSWPVSKIRTGPHSHDGDQAQRPGHHQEPPEHAREVTSAHGSAKHSLSVKTGPRPAGGPPARQGNTQRRAQSLRPPSGVANRLPANFKLKGGRVPGRLGSSIIKIASSEAKK